MKMDFTKFFNIFGALFPQPKAIPTPTAKICKLGGLEDDAKAIVGDWKAVGKDIEKATQRIEPEFANFCTYCNMLAFDEGFQFDDLKHHLFNSNGYQVRHVPGCPANSRN